MKKNELHALVIEQKILNRIYIIRSEKVMLDRDLAELFGIETRALKQAVKRNIERFPKDFMFEMTVKEIETMVSQNVIPSKSYFYSQQCLHEIFKPKNFQHLLFARLTVLGKGRCVN